MYSVSICQVKETVVWHLITKDNFLQFSRRNTETYPYINIKHPHICFTSSFQSTSDLVTPVIVSARLEERNIRSSSEITPTLNMFNGNDPDQPPLKKRKRVRNICPYTPSCMSCIYMFIYLPLLN